jgi:1-deoxy-D-xylulose 5-phosphate reductoisomerase
MGTLNAANEVAVEHFLNNKISFSLHKRWHCAYRGCQVEIVLSHLHNKLKNDVKGTEMDI